ncbi:hypothetical protein Holit_02298 [Hollandina sp. SP2]
MKSIKQSDLFSEDANNDTALSKNQEKMKDYIDYFMDKYWDIGLIQKHRTIILMHELKSIGYKKTDFENIKFSLSNTDKYDYEFLLEDILKYFDSEPISVKKAQDIFYNQRIIPNTIGSLHFINSSVRKCLHDDYTTSFIDRWHFFHGKKSNEAVQKLDLFLKKYTPDNDFDKLVYDFYKQFSGLIKRKIAIIDCDKVTIIQKYIKDGFDEIVKEIKMANKERKIIGVNEKNILQRMRKKIVHNFFNDKQPELKMLLGGHYRNEILGKYNWADYRSLLLKLIDKNAGPRKNLEIKYRSMLLPEERTYDG